MFKLPTLTYKYSDLEPYIDAKTMEIHHSKHHQNYTDNLNIALSKYPELQKLNIQDLLLVIDKIPHKIRQTVINNGGGYINHNQFWQILNPFGSINPSDDFLKIINEYFNSLEHLILRLQEQGLSLFGSGWVWLVVDVYGKISVMTTTNQDSPFMYKLTPLLGIDLWEHAYYLKYQNKRKDYLESIFKIINWQIVSRRYQNFMENK